MSPRDTPIKAVHIWLAVAVLAGTMLTGIFKIGQWSGEATTQLKSINESVGMLSAEVKKAAEAAQQAKEKNIEQDGEINALKATRQQARPFGGISVQ